MHRLPILTEQTRHVVEQYDGALKQIAVLTKENRSLREKIRENEINAMRLIAHYEEEVDTHTNLVAKLRKDLHALEIDRANKQQSVNDKSTWIEQGDLQSDETEMLNKIYMLENEIQSLKDNRIKQISEFERKHLVNQANIKQTFEEKVEVLRQIASDAVCNEVQDALVEILRDNDRLTNEFRVLLRELEKLQVSRERENKELLKTRQDLEFMEYKYKSMKSSQRRVLKEAVCQYCEKKYTSLTHPNLMSESEVMECSKVQSVGESKSLVLCSLEDYFKQCLKKSKTGKL